MIVKLCHDLHMHSLQLHSSTTSVVGIITYFNFCCCLFWILFTEHCAFFRRRIPSLADDSLRHSSVDLHRRINDLSGLPIPLADPLLPLPSAADSVHAERGHRRRWRLPVRCVRIAQQRGSGFRRTADG